MHSSVTHFAFLFKTYFLLLEFEKQNTCRSEGHKLEDYLEFQNDDFKNEKDISKTVAERMTVHPLDTAKVF